jgi:hypothetical protein
MSTADEGPSDDEGLRQPVRARLDGVLEVQPPLRSGVLMMSMSRIPASMRVLSG